MLYSFVITGDIGCHQGGILKVGPYSTDIEENHLLSSLRNKPGGPVQ
jgi:hypothetical protein